MAQFDLKSATIKFKDGYAGPGGTFQINNGAGYMAAATTVLVDIGTGIIATGDRFTIAGETGSPIHTVSSHSETSSNTTSITFTPSLASSVADDANITILPHELEINVAEGTVTFAEKKPRVYVKNRGLLGTVRNADEDPVEVKFEILWEYLKAMGSESVPTPEDFLKQRGPAVNFTSTSSDTCEPFAINVEIKLSPICSGQQKETILLETFRYEELSHDAKAGIISCSGKCNKKEATITRSDT